jgi:hypothetical protein
MFFPEINPLTGTLTTPVILLEGKTWYRCETIDPERNYSTETKFDTPGPYTEVSVLGFLPDDSPENALSIAATPFHQFIVAVKERTGIIRIIGNLDAGAQLPNSYESADLDGVRGYKLSFTWRNPLPPPLYLITPNLSEEQFNPPWDMDLFSGEFADEFN